MGNISTLKNHLEEFWKNRQNAVLPSPYERKEYAKVIGDCFFPCAQKILGGYFRVFNRAGGNEISREIHPTSIELYYHEEGAGRFKDPIMYHTDDRKRSDEMKRKTNPRDYYESRGIESIPYYPFGSINPHVSGIDITFENPVLQCRASFLIREYDVVYESGKRIRVKNSTEIYDDMLIQGIPMGDSGWIEWCDGGAIEKEKIECIGRRNVPEFKETEQGIWKRNTDIESRDSFSIGGTKYVKCPFPWQFKVKK